MSKEDLEEMNFGYLKPRQACSHVDLEKLNLAHLDSQNQNNKEYGNTLTVD